MSSLTKRLSWALALSVALNLFLIGFGSARFMRREAHGAELRARFKREHPRLLLGAPTPELREQRRALELSRKQVADALLAEPYDRARLAEALRALRETTQRGQALLHEHLLGHAATLSAEQRRSLAQRRFLHELEGRERDRPPPPEPPPSAPPTLREHVDSESEP